MNTVTERQLKVIRSIPALRAELREARRSGAEACTIGFVPTMGFLHEGHASLLEAARRQCDVVVLSIFVNPLQFGPGEDFERYPRDEARDLKVAAEAGADIVFMPDAAEMYPRPVQTTVQVSGVTERLCGASRPGHFEGVATVVTKLFNIVQPDLAFFGLKDAQQVAVIEQMVRDLSMPVQIVACPTLREADGLAKSSRNVYLNEAERAQAVVLHEALAAAGELIRAEGASLTAERLETELRTRIGAASLAEIDYAEVLAYPSLQPITLVAEADKIIMALAVKFGRTRLIDNRIAAIGAQA